MSVEDYFPVGDVPGDPHGFSFFEKQHAHVECKRCGVGGLHWEGVDGKWVLSDNYKVHVCDPARVNKGVANDFEDLGK